jgi:2'-5' RNA ligase
MLVIHSRTYGRTDVTGHNKAHYLIEFRFQGQAKKIIKNLIWDADKACTIGNVTNRRPVPHITLVGSFTTNKEKKLIGAFNHICSTYPLMSFTVIGFNTFEDNRVMYLDIKPSPELDDFRWQLSKDLQNFCKLSPIDHNRKYYFHSTIATKLSSQKFSCVKKYIGRKDKPDFKHFVVRATILKNGKILREYDFLLRRPLTRRYAKSRATFRKTMFLLNEYFDGKFDPNKNTIKETKTLWEKIKCFFGA